MDEGLQVKSIQSNSRDAERIFCRSFYDNVGGSMSLQFQQFKLICKIKCLFWLSACLVQPNVMVLGLGVLSNDRLIKLELIIHT